MAPIAAQATPVRYPLSSPVAELAQQLARELRRRLRLEPLQPLLLEVALQRGNDERVDGDHCHDPRCDRDERDPDVQATRAPEAHAAHRYPRNR